MDIAEACRTVHEWQEAFAPGAALSSVPKNFPEAVAVLKRNLENAKCDGKSIHELAISEHLLMTREGVRWVMPFVLSAESMEAPKRRKVSS
jgi:urease gamma subunit